MAGLDQHPSHTRSEFGCALLECSPCESGALVRRQAVRTKEKRDELEALIRKWRGGGQLRGGGSLRTAVGRWIVVGGYWQQAFLQRRSRDPVDRTFELKGLAGWCR